MTSLPAPGWWQFAVLALAAFRVYRLVARDTLTEPLRAAVTYPDDSAVTLGERPSDVELPTPRSDEEARLLHSAARTQERTRVARASRLAVVGDDEQPKTWRVYASTLIRCPWCVGFYVSAAWWLLWVQWPTETMFAASPWAISAVVALLAKNLDE